MSAEVPRDNPFYAAALRNIGDAVIATDARGIVAFINPAAEQLTGWSQANAVGQPIAQIFAVYDNVNRQALENPVEKALSAKSIFRTNTGCFILSRDDREKAVEYCAAPIHDETNGTFLGAVVTFRDVSEQRESEEQLRHSQRLESLGILASGIAHDFNNLLTPILGFADLAKKSLAPDAPIAPMIQHIEEAARRASDLIRQMLTYTGKARFIPISLNISSLIRDFAPLLRHGIVGKAQLAFDLEPDLPSIEADAGQIQQIVMNLVTNSAEAIVEKPGTIRIRTSRIEANAADLHSPFMSDVPPPGLYVKLEASDSGSGIPAENLPNIFDPFFTTKFTGRGLGLSSVLGIVRSLRGSLKVRSTPGKGTTFTIFFPAVRPIEKEPEAPKHRVSALRRRETVLVVDDEEPIQTLVLMSLANCGFRVLLARDSSEALSLLAHQGTAIDLLLLDLTLPDRNGLDTLREIRKTHRDLPVILMSGHSASEVQTRPDFDSSARFLQKPFTSQQVVESVRRMLRGPR